MSYLLDADVFIRAKNEYYGFELCPGFWDWLKLMNDAGRVYSVDAVRQELLEGDDDLAQWVRDHRPFFLSPSMADVGSIAAVNRWANDSPNYEVAAKAEFARAADSFLLGQARVGEHIVVTHEVISDTRRKIKIPNAAAALGIEVCNPFHMLRAENARFVLATRSEQPTLPTL